MSATRSPTTDDPPLRIRHDDEKGRATGTARGLPLPGGRPAAGRGAGARGAHPRASLKEFEFHGYVGKRRVVSYGWHYDFGERSLRETEEIPAFLLPLRDRAAAFADLAPDELPHTLVTEYGPGAAIGWHRDKGVFGDVVGVSLLSPCVFRLRRKAGAKWERYSLTAEPRSAYLLRGPSRTEWEHSIPAVDALRYSITFRSLRAGR